MGVEMMVSLYRAEDIGDRYGEVFALRGQWSHVECAGELCPIAVLDIRIKDGWVQAVVDITTELTNFVLGAVDPEKFSYPHFLADVNDLPRVLFRIIPADNVDELLPIDLLFPEPDGMVTPNCPLCGTPGMMVSTVQAACGAEACAMFLWDVTKTREYLLANTAEAKMQHNSLDPESESP